MLFGKHEGVNDMLSTAIIANSAMAKAHHPILSPNCYRTYFIVLTVSWSFKGLATAIHFAVTSQQCCGEDI